MFHEIHCGSEAELDQLPISLDIANRSDLLIDFGLLGRILGLSANGMQPWRAAAGSAVWAGS